MEQRRLQELEEGLHVLREAAELLRFEPDKDAAVGLFVAWIDAEIAAVRRIIRDVDGSAKPVRRGPVRSLRITLAGWWSRRPLRR